MARRLVLLAGTALSLAAGAATAATAQVGDPMTGRALFIGARAQKAGGPPCGACHAIGGESAPFSASLGPELSQSFAGLDAAAVDGMLSDPPFPTMAPLYARHPLTPAERLDLSAFLLQASGKPAPGGGRVAVYAALVAAALLGLLGLVARQRKGSAREALLARARSAPAPRPRRRAVTAPAPSPSVEPQPAAARRAHGGAR